jgi:tetratricopeptide (TPR) repeat protein
MKKLVFASAMVLMGLSLVVAPKLKAQNTDQITIKDPGEYNAYQVASTQTDPKAQASALEGFLTAYPQSVVKKSVLGDLIKAYLATGDLEHALSASSRLLQVDPANLQAIYTSVVIKKIQCGKTSDAQTCDDMGALAQKGLASQKSAELSDADWQKTVRAFHSALALDYLVGKKDVKAAINEYRTELLLFPLTETTSGPGLVDTLQLAEAYAKPDARDMVLAVWFYARAWNFAPPAFKAQIAPKMEYWYKRYHGKMDAGLDDIKTAAAKTLFKPDDVVIKAAPTPAELAHEALTGGDLSKLNLEDKEFILANGVKEDSDKIWTLMKGQTTPVPGIVIEASATVIKVAVTQTAKEAKTADFIVNLKKPLDEKDIPAVGFEFKAQPATELDATIDSFTITPAVAPNPASAQIVASDGFVQAEKKAKPAAPAHKPGAAHHK